MSALEPTEEEMQDLVTVILPRIIVEAMNNPEGEFYNGEITDLAYKKALESQWIFFGLDSSQAFPVLYVFC